MSILIKVNFDIYLLEILKIMKAMINMRYMFSSKKLSIADTAKVIQDKIMNITQVVSFI